MDLYNMAELKIPKFSFYLKMRQSETLSRAVGLACPAVWMRTAVWTLRSPDLNLNLTLNLLTISTNFYPFGVYPRKPFFQSIRRQKFKLCTKFTGIKNKILIEVITVLLDHIQLRIKNMLIEKQPYFLLLPSLN